MIRPAEPMDTPALVSLASDTGILDGPDEIEAIRGILDDLHAGRLGEGHAVHLWADGPGASPTGWVYFAPAAMTMGTWDLWFIGVAPARQGQGIGGELVRSVESHVRQSGGRILIVETSSLPTFDETRRFYAKLGYLERGRVPDYYADGNGKVIYTRRVTDRVDQEDQ